MADVIQYGKSKLKDKLAGFVQQAESMRRDTTQPMDVTLGEILTMSEGDDFTMAQLYQDLGLDPTVDTINNIFTLPDAAARWLVPEIFRDALRLGLRKAPIYPQIIAAEQTVSQLSLTIPSWNMSDAKPKFVGQGETIQLGSVSFGQKTITLRKMGRGFKIPYEVRRYVSINVISIFIQDFGVKLGQGIDTMLIDVLLNGEQANGSESAPVVGIAVPGTLTYRDLLRIWVRMGRIGRNPVAIIGGEDAAIDTLDLTEFKTRNQGTPDQKLNMKTPIPQTTDYYVHGAVPADQQIIIDSGAAVVKYNAAPLLIESEKIVSNQTEAVYATLTTGFGTMFRDARVVVDSSLAFSTNGFPSYMDPTTQELVVID